MNIPVTSEQYWMGRDKEYEVELTKEIGDNAVKLLLAVNGLLDELGIVDVEVSSGWRPKTLNAQLKNASPKSYHVRAMAVDLRDKGHKIYDAIAARPDLLKKYGLWMEYKDATPTWCHLDIGTRTDRPIRIFKP